MSLYLGIDVGTSGCRVIAIDEEGQIRARAMTPLPPPHRSGSSVEQDPDIWWDTVMTALGTALQSLSAAAIQALAVDATSATVLMTDADGRPLGPALMYNDARSREEAERIARTAPTASAAHGPTGSLSKLLHLQDEAFEARYALHQADWLAGRFCGCFGVTDENNALKMGYDPSVRTWPEWLYNLGVRRKLLPRVVAPAEVIGTLKSEVAQDLGLRPETQVVAGTTDSVAAFIATGATQAGDAVTSLGTTLVVKVLSDVPVFAPEYGIYSHRLGNRWLAGGASNTGGAVLLRYFTEEELQVLEPQLQPARPTGLDFYPLLAPGERFPVNDPEAEPRLTPRPESRTVFYQGILEGIAQIERRGYELLQELGAPVPVRILTVGGGASNAAWRRIRARILDRHVITARHHEAAYGAALLARQGAER